MKKDRSKEELIEYFIKQLGDNKILGDIYTIEQIREKLNNIIKNVTYYDEEEYTGTWRMNIYKDGEGTINFDTNKIPDTEESVHIAHELLHALSTTSKTIPVDENTNLFINKCGIQYTNVNYIKDKNKIRYFEEYSRGINEGITDILAEKITGINHNGYDTEKRNYRFISIIVSEEEMLKIFFDENLLENESPLDIFQKELIKKYGSKLGNDINDDLKKILSLSGNLSDCNSYEVNKKISDAFISLFEKVIDNEHNLNKKIHIAAKIQEYGDFSNISNQINKKVRDEIIGNNELSAEEKLEFYIKSMNESYSNDEDPDRIYKLLVETGKIIESKISKNTMFRMLFKTSILLEENNCKFKGGMNGLEKALENFTYYPVGEYYIAKYGKVIIPFDSNGHLLFENKKINYLCWHSDIYNNDSAKEMSQEDIDILLQIMPENQIDKLQDKLISRFKSVFIEGKKQGKKIIQRNNISIIEDSLLVIEYGESQDLFSPKVGYDMFSIKPNGEIELIPQRN